MSVSTTAAASGQAGSAAHRQLRTYLEDVSRLLEGGAGVDIAVFRGTVPTSGGLTQPPLFRCKPSHHYFLIEVRGSCTAATDLDDIDEIRFNAKIGSESLFSADLEMMSLMSPQRGNPVPIRFAPGGRWIKADSQISGVFTRRASTITTARVATVTMVFLLLPVDKKL